MGGIDGFKLIQVGMDVKAVGGHAQEHVRIGGADPGQGFHGFIAVGKGVAGACDAHHGCVGFGLNHFGQVGHGLVRAQNGGGDPGTASFTQSNFLLQKLHWMLQAGATGRCTRPKSLQDFLLKQGWLSKFIMIYNFPYLVSVEKWSIFFDFR